jgi:phospholipid/cholesterol/gamma-HCH transport system substrate-binding protein
VVRRLVAVLVAGVLLPLAACSRGGEIRATTVVDDVADMAKGAPVMFADVTVGSVSGISLTDDNRAKLTLSIEKEADIPADVIAKVRRTSVIGEKFVALEPMKGAGDAALEDGATIADSEVVPDFEQLVSSGTALLGAVSANELALLLDEGARGFGGNGDDLRAVLDGFDTVLAGYASRSETIANLVRAIDTFAASVGPQADAHAAALVNLSEATRILAEERVALMDLLQRLRDLSLEGRSILDAHMERMQRQLNGLRVVTDVLRERQRELGLLLENLPIHNSTITSAVRDDYAQVLNDIILCGVPGGGEDPSSPLNSCSYVPQEPEE